MEVEEPLDEETQPIISPDSLLHVGVPHRFNSVPNANALQVAKFVRTEYRVTNRALGQLPHQELTDIARGLGLAQRQGRQIKLRRIQIAGNLYQKPFEGVQLGLPVSVDFTVFVVLDKTGSFVPPHGLGEQRVFEMETDIFGVIHSASTVPMRNETWHSKYDVLQQVTVSPRPERHWSHTAVYDPGSGTLQDFTRTKNFGYDVGFKFDLDLDLEIFYQNEFSNTPIFVGVVPHYAQTGALITYDSAYIFWNAAVWFENQIE